MESNNIEQEIISLAASKPLLRNNNTDKDSLKRNVQLVVQMKVKIDNKVQVEKDNLPELKNACVLYKRVQTNLNDVFIPKLRSLQNDSDIARMIKLMQSISTSSATMVSTLVPRLKPGSQT